MSESLEESNFKNIKLCDWCSIPLGSANTIEISVCVRCYKLLIRANLLNDEIFGSRNLKKDGSLPLKYEIEDNE